MGSQICFSDASSSASNNVRKTVPGHYVLLPPGLEAGSFLARYITPKNILTMSTDDGDLVYVIRASLIDDKAMMSKVSVQQLVDYLLYVKEVHSLVVNARSERSGRLCRVIFANDITATRKAPDPQFSKGLSESSKSYERLYPSLAGPTMILNLPFILQAFVAFFKPLFPKSVQARGAEWRPTPVFCRAASRFGHAAVLVSAGLLVEGHYVYLYTICGGMWRV